MADCVRVTRGPAFIASVPRVPRRNAHWFRTPEDPKSSSGWFLGGQQDAPELSGLWMTASAEPRGSRAGQVGVWCCWSVGQFDRMLRTLFICSSWQPKMIRFKFRVTPVLTWPNITGVEHNSFPLPDYHRGNFHSPNCNNTSSCSLTVNYGNNLLFFGLSNCVAGFGFSGLMVLAAFWYFCLSTSFPNVIVHKSF